MTANGIKLFLCGDVMTGRGVDQVLPHPSNPVLYEPFVRSAEGYVRLAEAKNGPIPRPVAFTYIWGDTLKEVQHAAPDLRLINLETAVTTSEEAWPGKGINYRMHPDNLPCLTAAGIDCCSLANNHVLDWGYPGLTETLATLDQAGIQSAGAGDESEQAWAPVVLEIPGKGRVLVFAVGSPSSGIPESWAARPDRAGVALLPDLSQRTARRLASRITATKQSGDLVIVSIHWGGNWGYRIPQEQITFAHHLIDEASVDIIHGHSAHHIKGIEVYQGRPIFYGCGDFLNDYEGIDTAGEYRDDLTLVYLPSLAPESGELQALEMVPMQIRYFQTRRAPEEGARWLAETLDRECGPFGARTRVDEDGRLQLVWN